MRWTATCGALSRTMVSKLKPSGQQLRATGARSSRGVSARAYAATTDLSVRIQHL